MKKIFLIGHLDFRMFLKDKTGYFWLFVAPALFVYFFGFVNRPPADPSNPIPGILIENLDKGTIGELFIAELGEQGISMIEPENRDSAKRGIRIPEDFSAKIRNEERVDVEFFKLEESQEAVEFMVELRIVRTLLSMNTHLFQFVYQGGELETMDSESLIQQLAEEDIVSMSVEWGSRKPLPHGFNQTLPGTLLTFLMMNLTMFGASSISQTRLTGVIKRLAIYPLARWELVTGKIYGLCLLALIQILVFLLLGEYVFKVQISHNPLGIAFVLIIFSWIASSLGVLVGAYITSPEKTYGICIGSSMVMSAFGGCWWPMEVVNDGLKTFGHVFPTAWGMDALHQLISFGADTHHIIPELIILAAYAATAHMVANLSLRYR